jgi:hypothetical protein
MIPHLILFVLITLTIFGEAYKLWSPHYAVFSSLPPFVPLRAKCSWHLFMTTQTYSVKVRI